MGPEYYERQADAERKRLEGHTRKIADADAKIASSETASARAAESATRTSSESMARSKLREAERHRTAAARARSDRAAASKAASESQRKIHDHERRAREARAKHEKKERDERRRADDRARREAQEDARRREREKRQRAEQEAARARELEVLAGRTQELEQRLAAARRAAPKSITVLFLAGTIEGGSLPLRLDREVREIDQKLQASKYRDQIRFEQHHATQIRDIIDALNRYDPDIVHFSGHGARSSLLFEGADGRPQELRDEHLALLLAAARRPIRAVVFNACRSAEQAVAATDYVEVAVGMEEPIADEAAKSFAGQLYASLGAGNSVASAFEQARVQAEVVHDHANGRPQLYTRAGIDPTEIVLVAP